MIMTKQQKEQFISLVCMFLESIIKTPDDISKSSESTIPEMLTIQECSSLVHGFSQYTIRKLIRSGEIPSVRSGTGPLGKLLIPKKAVLEYFKNMNSKNT